MTTCRSCGEPIVWVRMKKKDGTLGKSMPLDATEDGAARLFQDGNVKIVGVHRDGDREEPMARVVPVAPGQARSHFTSCPHRQQHRSSR